MKIYAVEYFARYSEDGGGTLAFYFSSKDAEKHKNDAIVSDAEDYGYNEDGEPHYFYEVREYEVKDSYQGL